MYKKKTLRHMQPVTRRYARMINDLASVLRRLKNLTDDIDRLEADSRALHNRQTWEKALEVHAIHDPIDKTTKILYQPAPEDLLRQQQEAADEL
jgi:hypothetical protein